MAQTQQPHISQVNKQNAYAVAWSGIKRIVADLSDTDIVELVVSPTSLVAFLSFLGSLCPRPPKPSLRMLTE
jgi:hypothetical protein